MAGICCVAMAMGIVMANQGGLDWRAPALISLIGALLVISAFVGRRP